MAPYNRIFFKYFDRKTLYTEYEVRPSGGVVARSISLSTKELIARRTEAPDGRECFLRNEVAVGLETEPSLATAVRTFHC